MEMSDNELVEQFRQGNKGAFERLMERHRLSVFRLAHRMVHNRSEAEELTHCAFINVHQNIGSFRRGSNFRAWLYRITVNLCINHLKEKSRTKTVSLRDYDRVLKRSPHDELEYQELQELVRKAIEYLPPEQKAVLVLRVYEGLSHSEIARLMECSEKTIRWRLWRARAKLSERFGQYL